MAGKFKKKVLPWITAGVMSLEALVNFGCKGNPVSPDSPPYFTSSTPTAETTQTNIGNSHTVKGTAKDPDGDSINYKTLKDGTQVNNTNEYTFTINKKGMTKIQIVAYNALSDTLTKYFSANNQKPTAIDTSIVMDEESTAKIPESKLGSDADNDNLNYTITSTSGGISAKFENNQLEITGLQDYFGNANVNYNVNDNESNADGTINLTINNTPDNPQANAGEDQTGTINEEITLDGTNSSHPDNPLSNIVSYEWKTLNNDEENININNADQKTATLKANTRGQYQIELTTTDNKNATDKDTTNITINSYKIAGNITELFNDGVSIAGANVQFGSYNTTTNAQGDYNLELKIGTNNARLIITHPNFHERQTSEFTAKDTTLDETMVDGEFNMEHYDLITRYRDQTKNPGTQRWVTTPTIYIDTSPADNGDGTTTPVTQANIDTAIAVIKDLPRFAKGLFPGDSVKIEIGNNKPAWGTENYIILNWDNTIPGRGEHAEWVSSNIINSGGSKVKTYAGRGTYLQELTQNLGGRNDSNIVTPSVLNEPHGGEYYFEIDLKTGELLYSRTPGNLFPDKDP